MKTRTLWTRLMFPQVKDRDDRLVRAKDLLQAKVAAKDEQLEAAKVCLLCTFLV